MSEPFTPPKMSSFMKNVANPIARWMAERGIGPMGKQLLVLETRGRRSGKVYKTPLGPLDEGGALYLIASRGPRTDWYRNALAAGTVTVTRAGRRSAMRAAAVTDPAEKATLMQTYQARFPQVQRQFAQAAGSDDPAVIAERVGILCLRA
ncbi:MAG: nitroreductase family deazaflavin-dependent oxidoreductase [Chloroflexota bacterium]|nr:nitroreductase family deazaflavin-dependent oxidoreductase [Chloroflexota bacterium]